MKKPIEAIIDDVIIEPNKIQPIIVHFQNGQLKDEETNKIKCQLFNDEHKQKVVLAMSNGQVVYKGYRPNLENELTYTMLAIHNKKTGKVRLVQAERWDVAPVLEQHSNNNDDQNVDQNAQLNKNFGSKRVKRRTEQYEKMKVNVKDIKEQLEKTVQNVQIYKEDLENIAKDDFSEILPRCNKDAMHESEIYNIDDIVPKKILKTLYVASVEISESYIVDKPKFFMKTAEHVKTDPKSTSKIAVLLYIEAIANWLNKPLKSAKSKDLNICEHSTDVNSYVLQNYSMNSTHGRQKPQTMRHKGLIHCIILGLIIWDYKLDMEQFSTMFTRLGTKKLIELARCIGAVPTKNDKKSVILQIPLPEPVTKVISKKKK